MPSPSFTTHSPAWRYTGELFLTDEVDDALLAAGIAPSREGVERAWQAQVTDVLARATLRVPETSYMQRGGRVGRHTEHLGRMLAEMQIVARSHPGAKW